jgi:uncharacterized protein YjiS (DUF1127 family)
MSTTDCGTDLDLLHESRGPQSPVATVLQRTKSVWRAFRNRMAANSLYDLDDSQLNDIGITRHDVVMALDRSGLLDDPSRLLAGVARQRSYTRFKPAARR